MKPKNADDSEAVETAADFVEYLYLLSEEYTREAREYPDPIMASGNWAQRDIGIFLERWGSWLQAMGVEGRPHYPKEQLEPSWQSFARQLDAARGYE